MNDSLEPNEFEIDVQVEKLMILTELAKFSEMLLSLSDRDNLEVDIQQFLYQLQGILEDQAFSDKCLIFDLRVIEGMNEEGVNYSNHAAFITFNPLVSPEYGGLSIGYIKKEVGEIRTGCFEFQRNERPFGEIYFEEKPMIDEFQQKEDIRGYGSGTNLKSNFTRLLITATTPNLSDEGTKPRFMLDSIGIGKFMIANRIVDMDAQSSEVFLSNPSGISEADQTIFFDLLLHYNERISLYDLYLAYNQVKDKSYFLRNLFNVLQKHSDVRDFTILDLLSFNGSLSEMSKSETDIFISTVKEGLLNCLEFYEQRSRLGINIHERCELPFNYNCPN